MKLLNIYSVGIGALLLGLISTPAMAVQIDLFNDANDGFQFVQDLTQGSTPVSDTDTSLTGVIGEQRTIQVNKRNGATQPTITSSLSIDPESQVATFSSANSVRSDFSITWDGNYGAGGIDLTEGGTQKSILLNIVSNDLGGTLVFDITDINGGTRTMSQTFPTGQLGGIGNQFFRFDRATGNGDLTKASKIKLSSTNTIAGLDMSFAFVESSAAVPFEFSPGMGILFFGGLFGVHRLKKKLKTC